MAQMTLFIIWASFVGGGGGNKVDTLPSLLVLAWHHGGMGQWVMLLSKSKDLKIKILVSK